MNKAARAKIKDTLKTEEHELQRRLKPVTHKDAHERSGFSARFPEYGSKDDENAAEVASFQDNVGLETDLQKSLDDVRAALKKIDAGTYGVCESCGNSVGIARLRALPAARTCIDCHERPAA